MAVVVAAKEAAAAAGEEYSGVRTAAQAGGSAVAVLEVGLAASLVASVEVEVVAATAAQLVALCSG